MSEDLSRRLYLPFLVSISFLGLFFVASSAFFPSTSYEVFPWQKQLVGSIFALICLLGMTAVFFPSRCSTIFHKDNTENRKQAVQVRGNIAFHKTSIIFGLKLTHGHHPGCQGFTAHEFQIGRKTFCTACMGLFLGALMALFGVAVHFFQGRNIIENVSLFLILGVLGVGLGLLQYMFFDIQWRLFRFLSNAFFIFGAFLVLASIDTIVNSLILDFFVVFLSVFWLFTRILLSKHIHSRICQNCGLKCEAYG